LGRANTSVPDAVLVTGDRALIDGAPGETRVLSPREFLG
jgi:hypothetical protein